MLLVRLLRSIVSSSLDEVAPSIVNGMLCLPAVTARRALRLHWTIGVGEPHVERVHFLRVQLRFDVQRERAEQRHARAKPQPPGVPLVVVALVGVDRGEIVLEAAGEQDPLHDGIRRVVVDGRELLPDLVVGGARVRSPPMPGPPRVV